MKNINLIGLGALLLLSVTIFFTQCKKTETIKSHQSTNKTEEISQEVIQKLQAAGFITSVGLERLEDGYIVEYDIYIPNEVISKMGKGSVAVQKKASNPTTKHYRSGSLITFGWTRHIWIYIDPNFSPYIKTGIDMAIARINYMNLRLTFERTSNASQANIKIWGVASTRNAKGWGEYPSNGNPGTTITLNTNIFRSTDTDINKESRVMGTILHELGHNLGFVHTDFMYTSSCAFPENQTDGSERHISGTPTGASAGSWMLACGPDYTHFTLEDRKALTTLFPFWYPDGSVRRETDKNTVYVIYGGAKFPIPSTQVLEELYGGWGNVVVVGVNELWIAKSVPRTGSLLREHHQNTVYYIEDGTKRPIPTEAILYARFGGWGNVKVVPDNTLSALPVGPAIQ